VEVITLPSHLGQIFGIHEIPSGIDPFPGKVVYIIETSGIPKIRGLSYLTQEPYLVTIVELYWTVLDSEEEPTCYRKGVVSKVDHGEIEINASVVPGIFWRPIEDTFQHLLIFRDKVHDIPLGESGVSIRMDTEHPEDNQDAEDKEVICRSPCQQER
jgi:hypothetical protein